MTKKEIVAELRRYGRSNRLNPWEIEPGAFIRALEATNRGERLADQPTDLLRWFYLFVAEYLS